MTFWQRLRGLLSYDLRPEDATHCAECSESLPETGVMARLPFLYCSADCRDNAIAADGM